jgi:ribokinase
MAKAPKIVVVGSVNLDFVASGAKLPAPGETVTGASLARHPGGKGANQALAARRLGADVRLVARVGKDGLADEALALLKADGVDLKGVTADPKAPTGVALIAVSKEAENQIVVCAGANDTLKPDHLPPIKAGALIMQMEIPIPTVVAAAEHADAMICINLAPAMDVPAKLLNRCDLIIVNETEAAFYGAKLEKTKALVAVTLGAHGAKLMQNGKEIASAKAPKVKAVDTTGAGDTFVGALVVALLEGQAPREALKFACTAGALTATRAGAQTSLPRRAEVDALLKA